MSEDIAGKTAVSPGDGNAAGQPRQQRLLLVFVIAGILFAGWYSWSSRARWMTLVDPNYNDPTIAAYARFSFEGEDKLPGYIALGTPVPGAIPALVDPEYIASQAADFLDGDDRVMGVWIDGNAVAYPLKVMQWHEAVNTTVGSTPILVTYCPLCDSASVLDRRVAGRERQFDVSGFLYNNNLLLFDTGAEEQPALWSQMSASPITGSPTDVRLRPLPVELTTWKSWQARHPETQVLSVETGHDRDYDTVLFQDYLENDQAPEIPIVPWDKKHRLPEKERVLGVWTGSHARAYPLSAFEAKAGSLVLEDRLGDHELTITYDPGARSLRVDSDEDDVHWMYAFYFAWYAFHPTTEIYQAQDEAGDTQPPQTGAARTDNPSVGNVAGEDK